MKKKIKFRVMADFETEINTEHYNSDSIEGCIKEAIEQLESDDGFDVLLYALESAEIKVSCLTTATIGKG